MKKNDQNHQDNDQPRDHERDRRDERDKELSPDMDFPETVIGSGQTPIGG